jgi:hypothetical protein
VLSNPADPNRGIFDDAVRRGTRGFVYSPRAGEFLNMAALSTDMQRTCQLAYQNMVQAHQNMVQISRVK